MDRKCVCIMLSFYAQCAVKVVYTDFTRPVLLNLTSFFSVYEIHLIERLTSPRPLKKKNCGIMRKYVRWWFMLIILLCRLLSVGL